MRFFIFLIIFSYSCRSISQNTLLGVKWEKCFGGSGSEMGRKILSTQDGGFVTLSRWSSSNDGDLSNTLTNPEGDIWVFKTNNNGIIEWQTKLGGTHADEGGGIISTADGGFLVAGTTYSSDGDVTSILHGESDYWIIKLNEKGNVVWSNTFGGSKQENLKNVICTSDGGFMLIGYTYSNLNDGDVTDFKGGSCDIWVVKTDSKGLLQWQKCIGGTDGDMGWDIIQISPSSYIIAGGTYSKDVDVFGNHGGQDIWLVKLDLSGNMIWQKCIGGSKDECVFSLKKSGTNSFLVAGYTSSINGDISGNHGGEDGWASEIDTMGNFIWKKCFGGTGTDDFFSGIKTIDGDFIFYGWTGSSNGDAIGNTGGNSWLIKFDSLKNNIVWQRSFGGASNEIGHDVIEFLNGGYALTGYTNSSDIPNSGFHGDSDVHSIIVYDCNKGYKSTSQLTITACDFYTLNNQTYTSSGIYKQVIPNKVGCDSIITLLLTINKSSSKIIDTVVCDSYTLNGEYYTKTGSYTQKITNSKGCDSVLTINLVVKQSNSLELVITACDSFLLNGITYKTSGQYSQIIKNSLGCDSTINLKLTVKKRSTSELTITACDFYTLNNQTYTSSGIYKQVIPNKVGCDSTITLLLTINKSSSKIIDTVVCDSYTLNSEYYTKTGSYTQKITNSKGCDSVLIINLVVKQSNSSELVINSCDSFLLNGITYKTSGQYSQIIKNSLGCDSTINLKLTVKKRSTSELTITACDFYTLNNQTYTSSGIYKQVIPNKVGCDSTITLLLTINKSSLNTLNITECNSFTAPDNNIYTSSGIYKAIIQNHVGCDSVITIYLKINNVPTPEICMVTTNDKGDYNIIYWDKSQYPSVDTFFVYREIQNNLFNIIGKVSKDSLSLFVDTVRTLYFPNTGDPRISSYKYKIALKDTCGNIGLMSTFHRTMFLQDQQNGNFNWNHYEIEGENSPISKLNNYILVRDDDQDGEFESNIGSTTSNQVSDPKYLNSSNLYSVWRVETDWKIYCNLSSINEKRVPQMNSKSNQRQSNTLSLIEFNTQNNKKIKLYPNVVNDYLIVECSENLISNYELIDLTGKILMTGIIIGKSEIDLRILSPSSYIIKFITKSKEESHLILKN